MPWHSLIKKKRFSIEKKTSYSPPSPSPTILLLLLLFFPWQVQNYFSIIKTKWKETYRKKKVPSQTCVLQSCKNRRKTRIFHIENVPFYSYSSLDYCWLSVSINNKIPQMVLNTSAISKKILKLLITGKSCLHRLNWCNNYEKEIQLIQKLFILTRSSSVYDRSKQPTLSLLIVLTYSPFH